MLQGPPPGTGVSTVGSPPRAVALLPLESIGEHPQDAQGQILPRNVR